jgi:hypothetical protein
MRLIFTVLPVLLAAAMAQAQAPAPPKPDPSYAQAIPTLTPDTVLLNPHMGLYVMGGPDYKPPADQWFMKVVDIVYVRDDWVNINPQEGVYKFDEYFGPIFDYWVKKCGKRVAFRFMSQCTNTNIKYVSPKWIFDKGVPGVKHVGLYAPEQIDPVFWDSRYLDIQCEFIKKLGKYLDGRPGVEFVDIGSIGEWGEMHLMRWTPQQLEETGFTETKYAMAYRRIIDAFASAFPHTRVFLCVGGQNHLSIDDYAAVRGVHFRQDGLKPDGGAFDCGEWLFKPYSRRGTVCNFEFNADNYDDMVKKGYDLGKTMDHALAAPISYLNTNLGDLAKAPKVVREELLRVARKIGYRFVVTKVKYRPEFHLDGNRPARIFAETTWRNDGIAPCYDSFAIEWTLLDEADKVVCSDTIFPEAPTTAWWQGEEKTVRCLMRLPAATKPGEYRLKVAVVLPETGQRILLGIEGADAQKRYGLCTLRGVAAVAGSGVVFEEGFETAGVPPVPAKPWEAVKGLVASIDTAAAHSGKASMLVSGTMGTSWNYASCSLPKPVIPGAKYRLSGWMLVERLKGIKSAPYLKVGVNGRRGDSLENYLTGAYDLTKMGTWQLLEGTFEAPGASATGGIAIEKGQFEGEATVTLRLDDVKLEALESP